eukprot:Sspe_Gene.46177::Locus_22998_Transcript_1_1_Confidence_1.000_Length_1065::g.46177::m.46177
MDLNRHMAKRPTQPLQRHDTRNEQGAPQPLQPPEDPKSLKMQIKMLQDENARLKSRCASLEARRGTALCRRCGSDALTEMVNEADAPTLGSVNLETIERNVWMLNNCLGDDPKVVVRDGKTTTIARASPVVLTFYADVLQVHDANLPATHILPYVTEEGQEAVRDLLSGFLPHLLSARYPRGVRVDTVNSTHTKAPTCTPPEHQGRRLGNEDGTTPPRQGSLAFARRAGKGPEHSGGTVDGDVARVRFVGKQVPSDFSGIAFPTTLTVARMLQEVRQALSCPLPLKGKVAGSGAVLHHDDLATLEERGLVPTAVVHLQD